MFDVYYFYSNLSSLFDNFIVFTYLVPKKILSTMADVIKIGWMFLIIKLYCEQIYNIIIQSLAGVNI